VEIRQVDTGGLDAARGIARIRDVTQVREMTSRRCDRGIARHGCGRTAQVNVDVAHYHGNVLMPEHRESRPK